MKEYICLVTVTVYVCEYSSHSYMSAMVNKFSFNSVMVNKSIHSVNIDLPNQLIQQFWVGRGGLWVLHTFGGGVFFAFLA